MAINIKSQSVHQFYNLNTSPLVSLPSARTQAMLEAIQRTRVTYKRPPRAYTPMNLSELLEWDFWINTNSTAHKRPLLTRNGVVDTNLDFTGA